MILEGSEVKDSGTLNTSLEGTELFAPPIPQIRAQLHQCLLFRFICIMENDKWKNDELFD